MTRLAHLIARARALAAPVPRPLVGILGVVAVVGVSWAMIMPPWQSPDSFTHYSYAESLATRFALPGRAGHNEASSSVRAAYRAAGVMALQWSSPEVKASWNPAAARAYRTASARLSRSNGAGITPSQANPPIYYAYAAAAYLATFGGDSLDRVLAIQLAGVLLLLATVVGAWLLGGEVFGRRPLLQLTTAAVAGLQPVETFMSTSVNPDALLVPLWTFWLWLGARVIKRGAPRRDVVALCAVTAAAILTKETSYAMLPPLVLVLVLGWRAHLARVGARPRGHSGPRSSRSTCRYSCGSSAQTPGGGRRSRSRPLPRRRRIPRRPSCSTSSTTFGSSSTSRSSRDRPRSASRRCPRGPGRACSPACRCGTSGCGRGGACSGGSTST